MIPSRGTKKGKAETLAPLPPDHILFGTSPTMADIRHRVEKICRMNVPVLICGPGGSGKEALARWIHAHSPFFEGEFVKVNCAAIPNTLLESELFGYERGAFTGAQNAKPGRVELAHRGTLFLDEISDLDPALQSKLLHFLQDGCFSRIGDQTERAVDTRLICATNRDLETDIQAGRFRADLYYRINVVRLCLPKLGDRRMDIPEIAEYLRQRYDAQFEKQSEPMGAELFGYLQQLDWPGNLRELSNGIARYVLIGPEALTAPSLPKRRSASHSVADGNDGMQLKRIAKDAIREMERNVILEELRANQWNRRKTAQALKISYRALIYKIRDAGIGSRRAQILQSRRTAAAQQPGSD
ncbi:MAG TPA: sigma-54 dependent transcriptional regulator [Terriglobales bacterium]|nr:sigma-54 dependent transcriptional regulator [Terriglobales bacterium]